MINFNSCGHSFNILIILTKIAHSQKKNAKTPKVFLQFSDNFGG